jgi:hypothetical protein
MEHNLDTLPYVRPVPVKLQKPPGRDNIAAFAQANGYKPDGSGGPNIDKPFGGSRRRRPSRKYKKSSKRVFRKKSRSTRRR